MKQEPQAWPLRVEYRQGTQRVWPPYSAVEHRHHHHHHHLLQALPPSRCRRGAMKRPVRSGDEALKVVLYHPISLNFTVVRRSIFHDPSLGW